MYFSILTIVDPLNGGRANVSNAFLLQKILLEVSFIEDIRTTWGNKELPLMFHPDSPYSRK